MKHRVLTTIALAVLACAAVASTATGAGNGRLFQFRGELTGITLNSLGLQVEGGNKPALRKMLGQSQNQTFAIGDHTEILIWRKGVPAVGGVADLKIGDWVQVNVHARAGSSLAEIEANQAGLVGDHVTTPERSAASVALRRHRRRRAVRRAHRPARDCRQPARASLAARPVGRPDLHL